MLPATRSTLPAMAETQLTRLQRVTYRVWLSVGLLVLGTVALIVLARPLAVLIPPSLVALLLVYLLNPVVSWLHGYGMPRLAGTLLSFLLFFGSITVFIRLLGPALVEQFVSFAEVAPELSEEFIEQINTWLTDLGVDFEVGGQFDPALAADQVQAFLADAEARGAFLTFLGGLSGLAAGLFTIGLAFVAGPFIAAYLLWDLPRVGQWLYRLIPPEHRDEVVDVARRLSSVVGGFIRGQLIIAAYVGIATSIGLALIGLPFWLVLGLIAGITNLVPFIGPFIAGALGVLVALFSDGVGLALLVLIVVTIVQQGDNQIVSPLVMGRTVRLHPLVVLLALLVAGTLYGIFGLLVAVPLVAGANVLLSHLWRTRVPWAAQDPPPAGVQERSGLLGRRRQALRSSTSERSDPADDRSGPAAADHADAPADGSGPAATSPAERDVGADR